MARSIDFGYPPAFGEALLEPRRHREAVEYHANTFCPLAQRLNRKVIGFARVDDQRLSQLASDFDLSFEGQPLILNWCAFAVLVKARLTDGVAERVGGQLSQLGAVGAGETAGIIGVVADGRRYRAEFGGSYERVARTRGVGADGEHLRYTGLKSISYELGVGRLAKVEMGMTVDHRCALARLARILREHWLNLLDSSKRAASKRRRRVTVIARPKRAQQLLGAGGEPWRQQHG